MITREQTFILRSTREVLERRAEEIGQKLINEMPERLRQSYETGGYWHDNALWEEATREQQGLHREFSKIREALRDVIFIEDIYLLLDEGRVTIGKTIKLSDVDTGEILEYSIVGPLDVTYNPQAKKAEFISYKAPFIQPLLEKSVGETVTVKLPMGQRTVIIREITPLSI